MADTPTPTPDTPLRQVLAAALRQMDADDLQFTLVALGMFCCAICIGWFVLIFRLAQLWKGCQ
jgi:hypothetical protein